MAAIQSYINQGTGISTTTLMSQKAITDAIAASGGLISSNGTNYIMVRATGTPEQNADEFRAAYTSAKIMPRYLGEFDGADTIGGYEGQIGQTFKLTNDNTYRRITSIFDDALVYGAQGFETITETEAKATRATIVLAPGKYKFGDSAFVVDASGIDIVSLTGNSDVIISSTEENSDDGYDYGIKVTANNVLVKGINCKTNTFYIDNNLDNLICEYCIGGDYSFGGKGTILGTFNYCTGRDLSFGGKGTATGIFNNCIGGVESFGGGINGTASGVFNNCIGAGYAFGGGGTTALGVFNNCTGGAISFGGRGIASGTFNYCTGDDNSFGGYGGNTTSGKFNYCTGGMYSFGGQGGTASGTLINCRLASGTFPTPTVVGKIYSSIDGNGNLINTSLPIFADNDAAASLVVGTMYRTSAGVQMIKW